jgi:hypothetical protein
LQDEEDELDVSLGQGEFDDLFEEDESGGDCRSPRNARSGRNASVIATAKSRCQARRARQKL